MRVINKQTFVFVTIIINYNGTEIQVSLGIVIFFTTKVKRSLILFNIMRGGYYNNITLFLFPVQISQCNTIGRYLVYSVTNH